MRLKTPAGAQAKLRKRILKRSEIVPSHGKVVNEVAGTRAVLERTRGEFVFEFLLKDE